MRASAIIGDLLEAIGSPQGADERAIDPGIVLHQPGKRAAQPAMALRCPASALEDEGLRSMKSGQISSARCLIAVMHHVEQAARSRALPRCASASGVIYRCPR